MKPVLHIYVPGRGWMPAAISGTRWDAEYWRILYRARGLCTCMVKRDAA